MTVAITLIRARAPKGERAFEQMPPNHGKRTTLLVSFSFEGGRAAMDAEGPTQIRPSSRCSSSVRSRSAFGGSEIVMLDDLGAHRVKEHAS